MYAASIGAEPTEKPGLLQVSAEEAAAEKEKEVVHSARHKNTFSKFQAAGDPKIPSYEKATEAMEKEWFNSTHMDKAAQEEYEAAKKAEEEEYDESIGVEPTEA